MSDALYQDGIIELARAGRALPRIEGATVTARVDNPVCGDRVTVDLMLEGDTIVAVGAKVQGCALCQASVAVIADNAVGRPASALSETSEAVGAYLAGGEVDLPWAALASFAPVRASKSRWECVMLPYRAAIKAVNAGS